MNKLSWLRLTDIVQKFIDEHRKQKAPPFDYYEEFQEFLEYFCKHENIDKDQFLPNCGYTLKNGHWRVK